MADEPLAPPPLTGTSPNCVSSAAGAEAGRTTSAAWVGGPASPSGARSETSGAVETGPSAAGPPAAVTPAVGTAAVAGGWDAAAEGTAAVAGGWWEAPVWTAEDPAPAPPNSFPPAAPSNFPTPGLEAEAASELPESAVADSVFGGVGARGVRTGTAASRATTCARMSS